MVTTLAQDTGEEAIKLEWRDGKVVGPIKLDIACGQSKNEGCVGIDIADVEGVDIVHDLREFPWPIEDGAVEDAVCSHYVEHTYPLGGPDDGLIAFMNELYRVMAPDSVCRIIHPYAHSDRAFQDPTHTRFIPDATWFYFDREWREAQKLDHYPITCDFQRIGCIADWNGDWSLRSSWAQNFALLHYWNVVNDLIVDLKKRG